MTLEDNHEQVEASKKEMTGLIKVHLVWYRSEGVAKEEIPAVRDEMEDATLSGKLVTHKTERASAGYTLPEGTELSETQASIFTSAPNYFMYLYRILNKIDEVEEELKTLDTRLEYSELFAHGKNKAYPTFLADLSDMVEESDDFIMTDAHREVMWQIHLAARKSKFDDSGSNTGGTHEITPKYAAQLQNARRNNKLRPSGSEA